LQSFSLVYLAKSGTSVRDYGKIRQNGPGRGFPGPLLCSHRAEVLQGGANAIKLSTFP
jgi:hypothetical protein